LISEGDNLRKKFANQFDDDFYFMGEKEIQKRKMGRKGKM